MNSAGLTQFERGSGLQPRRVGLTKPSHADQRISPVEKVLAFIHVYAALLVVALLSLFDGVPNLLRQTTPEE